MHYPHRPQRGEPIKASDIRDLADAAEAARFLPGQQFVASQSIRGIRVAGHSPTLLTIVQCIEDSHIAAQSGYNSSWAVTRAREMFLRQLVLYPRKPQRLLTICTPTSQIAGDVLLAWWDSTSGVWIGIPLYYLPLESGEDSVPESVIESVIESVVISGYDSISGDSGYDSVSGDSGYDSISGDSGYDSISGDSGYDSISGDSGYDSISGDSGYDSVSGDSGYDSVSGDDGSPVPCGGQPPWWMETVNVEFGAGSLEHLDAITMTYDQNSGYWIANEQPQGLVCDGFVTIDYLMWQLVNGQCVWTLQMSFQDLSILTFNGQAQTLNPLYIFLAPPTASGEGQCAYDIAAEASVIITAE